MAKNKQKKKKTPTHVETITGEKKPVTIVTLGSDSDKVHFYFGNFDSTFPDHSQCTMPVKDCLGQMKSFQSMTWNELKNHKSSSSKEVSIIIKDAQERLDKIFPTDRLHQLNFGGKKRLWGVRQENHFISLWWDPDHVIYPTTKKNT